MLSPNKQAYNMICLNMIREASQKLLYSNKAVEDYTPPTLEDDMSDIDVAIFNGIHPQLEAV